MKKFAELVSCLVLFALSGSAFAQSDLNKSALESLISSTDAQLAPAVSGAMEKGQAPAVPAPSAAVAAVSGVRLQDITDKCTQQGEVVSAYPGIYKLIHSEENSRIIRVFRFSDAKGNDRRVEVYFTGGDWMQYGLTYLATNAGPDKNRVNAYFIEDLSTPDREEGGIAPRIDPFDTQKLAGFIAAEFLNAAGGVKASFVSAASAAASAK